VSLEPEGSGKGGGNDLEHGGLFAENVEMGARRFRGRNGRRPDLKPSHIVALLSHFYYY